MTKAKTNFISGALIMKKLFLKKLSMKITFIIGIMILIVAGGVAGYMQTRIITEIGRVTKLTLQMEAVELADKGTSEHRRLLAVPLRLRRLYRRLLCKFD